MILSEIPEIQCHALTKFVMKPIKRGLTSMVLVQDAEYREEEQK